MTMAASHPLSNVVAPNTSPMTDQLVFGSDRRLFEYNIQVMGFRGPEAPSPTGEMWICFTPTGRAYIAGTSAGLAGAPSQLAPVMIDIARLEGAARAGLTRSVVVTPGSAPRIFSSQL